MIKRFLCFSVLVILLSGCDAYITVQGVILDRETRLPIGNVRIEREGEPQQPYAIESDQSGNFHISKISGMHHPLKLIFSRQNYKTIHLELSGPENDTVYLERAR